MKVSGSILDSTLQFFIHTLNLRSKILDRDSALKHAADLKEFVAIEITYKGQPIRMIAALSSMPTGFLKSADTKQLTAPELTAPSPTPVGS